MGAPAFFSIVHFGSAFLVTFLASCLVLPLSPVCVTVWVLSPVVTVSVVTVLASSLGATWGWTVWVFCTAGFSGVLATCAWAAAARPKAKVTAVNVVMIFFMFFSYRFNGSPMA